MRVARWTRGQVEEMAPDSKSVLAATKLARPGPWSDTGANEVLVWGKCQGSGSTTYQVTVDLTVPSVKCSCPSRKFPCKHGLALLMLWVQGEGQIETTSEVADFAEQWAEARAARVARSKNKTESKPASVDPAAQAKRLERRLELMDQGVADLQRWLQDMYRHGLAAARHQPYEYWDSTAARLVDSQMPALAARVREMPGRLAGRDDWADVILDETGRWFAVTRWWQQRDRLCDDELGLLRSVVGWPISAEEVKAGEVMQDTWLIEGLYRSDDSKLQTQRTWIRGVDCDQRFLVLDFAVAGNLGVPQTTGTKLEASIAAYPGLGIRRALFVEPGVVVGTESTLTGAGTIDDALKAAALELAIDPFRERTPVVLHGWILPSDQPTFVDKTHHVLPLTDDIDVWPILARCGPEPVNIFAELEDGRVRPLTIEVDARLVAL